MPSKEEIKEHTRFDEIHNNTFRAYLEEMYKKEYRKGWYISDVLKTKEGNWILKWERNLFDES